MLDFTRRTERKLRDRNSQLIVPNKSFARVRAVCEQQLHLMRQPQQKAGQPAKPAAPPSRVMFLSSHKHRQSGLVFMLLLFDMLGSRIEEVCALSC